MKKIVMGTATAAWMTVWMATGFSMHAQAAPVLSPATAQADRAIAPTAPQTAGADVNPFPPVNLKNFTATSPTREEVDSFLKALWGYDEARIWSVAAVLKTPAPGVAKVVVFVAEKGQTGKGRQTVFYITPDGKHAIADTVIDFGVKPFAATRQVMQDRAVGPAEGAAGKDLELVEFVDMQDPRSRQAQDTMASLVNDFPQARIVVEPLPITESHPFAMRAALDGVCVRKAKGDAAYFTYQQAVFDKQTSLTTAGVSDALNSAVTVAGADPKAVAACAASDEAKVSLDASLKLADDLGIDQTPILVANGRQLPLAGVSYDVLRKIIAFQAGQDGITVHLQPTLTTLK